MKGFFTEIEEPKPLSKTKDSCTLCGLSKSCNNPKIPLSGNGNKKILILGEAPGTKDDKLNLPFQGRDGILLRKELKAVGIDLHHDCWSLNSVGCHKLRSDKITKKELRLCKSRVLSIIDKIKPKHIWILGSSAAESFFGSAKYKHVRGWTIPHKNTNTWINAFFHPLLLLEQKKDNFRIHIFRKDLKQAVSALSYDPPIFKKYEDEIELVIDFKRAKQLLKNTLEFADVIAFDYETTGLKPYRKGHKIWCIGISTNNCGTYSMAVDYPHWNTAQLEELDDLFINILENPKIKKVAQNLPFENTWSRIIYDVNIQNWYWCTMNAAHIIDSRKGFTKLSYQAFLWYGVEDYDKDVAKFIKPLPGELFNRLDQVPLKKLLLYCGMDAKITYDLFEDQKEIFEQIPTFKKAYALTHQGLLALSDTEISGIYVDENYYNDQIEILKEEIKELNTKLITYPEVKQFARQTKRDINFKSPIDLRILLFDIFKTPIVKETNLKFPSVDKEVLESINIPFTKDLLKKRKMEKMKNTYLAQFRREMHNHKIHPFFNLHTARTYRSSSSFPNFQNIPTRDEEAKAVTRKGILPSPGNKIAEIDYRSMEFRIFAVYSNDSEAITYVKNPKSDIHRDEAKHIFKLTTAQSTDAIRFFVKNGYVFPEIYGSWYGACARDLWENCINLKTNDNITLKQHLRMNFEQFKNHVKKQEERLWNKMPTAAQWQENEIKKYLKNGYVEFLTGHRRGGYLTKNKILNTAIQGTAFLLLLWSYIQVNKCRIKENWKSKLMGQIHDSILIDLHPSEEKHVLKTVKRIMTIDIINKFSWITVPLEVDLELTKINASWYYKEKAKI